MIGARIRQLRGSASQQEFADRLGITREHVSRLESGAQPGTEVLRRLAQVTGVSLDFLVLGTDSAQREGALAAGAGWEAALGPLLRGTTLRLPRASTASGRRADRAWPELSEEGREDIRALVRRIAVVAVALEALLPAKAAKPVIDELGDALATLLVDRIVTAGGSSSARRRRVHARPIP